MSDFSVAEIRMMFISIFGIVLFNILVRAFVPDEEIIGEEAEEEAGFQDFAVDFDVPAFLSFGDAQAQAEGTTLMPDVFVAIALYVGHNVAGVIELMFEVVTTAVDIAVWFFEFLAFQAGMLIGAWQWVFSVAPSGTMVVLFAMMIPVGFFAYNAGAKVAMIIKDLIPFT